MNASGKNPRDALLAGDYLSLATRKRSGEFVATPVWFAPHGNTLYLFSAADAGKVKRLRNFSDAKVAPCTLRGKVLGEWLPASARILDSDKERAAALSALRAKYGWRIKITDAGARLTGRFDHRAYICVTLLTE